jgi:ABC-2 type transport system permease protein
MQSSAFVRTRSLRVASAFFRIAVARTLSYPMSLVMGELVAVVPMFTYFFLARLVDKNTASVGGDYFTFVVIGLMASHVLAAGLKDLSQELELAINQGRFEALLVEPISSRAIPFGLIEWPLVKRIGAAVVIVGVSLLLGAEYSAAGFVPALFLLLLGVLATLAVAIASGSVRILAKESDPLLTFYTLAVQVLSGVFFPVSVLPPFIRWISWTIPHTYVIQAARKVLMRGGADLPGISAGKAALALVLFNLTVLPLGLWLWGRALNFGRRVGVIGGY